MTAGLDEQPDVTVIVAVYNTLPYLTECLTSVLEQTIGTDRLEVVAVDDGSTDGSGAELDRFAARHPGTVRVVHQANSGGPAAPSNRALDLARGRYLFFLGADDHLGPEALRLLVARADELEADVIVGKMVGVNDRYVHQALYRESRDDIGFTDSALPWTLSNTKLFRRSLIEKHAIRYPEDLPVGSDQPFTVEACAHARRVAVLADYTCYYAVRRDDAANITYRSLPETRLACTALIMAKVAEVLPAGPDRDAVFLRHFTWELSKLTERPYLDLSEERREAIRAAIAALADRYLTPGIRDAVPVAARVRLVLAQRGLLEALVATVRASHGDGAPLRLEPAGAFAELPGFRDPAVDLPDSLYEVGGGDVSALLSPGILLDSLALSGRTGRRARLEVAVRTALWSEPDSVPAIALGLADRRMPESADRTGGRRLPADHVVNRVPTSVDAGDPAGPCRAVASIPLLPFLQKADDGPAVWGLRGYPQVAGATYEVPVRADGSSARAVLRQGRRFYEVAVVANDKARLVLRVKPTTWRAALSQLFR